MPERGIITKRTKEDGKRKSGKKKDFIDRQIGKHPRSLNEFAIMWLKYPKILPNAGVIPDMTVIKISDPHFSDKFEIGSQAIRRLCSEQADIPTDQLDAFLGVCVLPNLDNILNNSGKAMQRTRFSP